MSPAERECPPVQSLDQNRWSSRCMYKNQKFKADSRQRRERGGCRRRERGGDIVSDKERAPSYVLGLTMKSTCPLLPELASWEPCCFMVFDQIEIAIGAATAVKISCRLLFILYNL